MRRTPLERRTPLKRGRVRPKPRRAPQPSRDDWQAKREAIYARAGGRCEHCGCDLSNSGMEAHHRMLRSQGGGHGLENLTALCPRCHHDEIHAHPSYAKSKGFIVPSGGDPACRALHLFDGRIVRLTPDGTYDELWDERGEVVA